MLVCLVDLLLCGHHVRVSQAARQAAGAAVYDWTGLLIMAGIGTAAAPGPERPPGCQLLHGAWQGSTSRSEALIPALDRTRPARPGRHASAGPSPGCLVRRGARAGSLRAVTPANLAATRAFPP